MTAVDEPLVAVPTAPGSAGRARPRLANDSIVVVATGAVSILNYAYTVVLLWLLPARLFAQVGSLSALLLICGTIASASIPWVLTREVVMSRDDRARRTRAVTFCACATLAQGVGGGLALFVLARTYADSGALGAAFGAVVMIFSAATVVGYLQGSDRFPLIAVLRIAEVVVKIAAGVGLVAAGAGAGGAIAGFALGAGVVTAVGLVVMAPDLGWSWSAIADRQLLSSARGLFAIQAGVAVLASLDVVVGSLVLGDQPRLATYQAAIILGRIPVFLGTALSTVAFPRLVHAPDRAVVPIRDSLHFFVRVCLPVTAITASLPTVVTVHLFPARYGDVAGVLPYAAAGGLVMGAVNLTTTYFQAIGRVRRTVEVLAGGVGLGALLDVTALHLGGVVGLAVAVAIGGAIVAAAIGVGVHRTWPGSLRGLAVQLVAVGAACAPLWLLRGHLVLWALWAVGVAMAVAVRTLLAAGSSGDSPGTRPRVLHLGYEDPRRSGAGGGSVRTHEINRRLAADFDITVVCARYRGSRPRCEDGVQYRHVGLPGGYFSELLAYFACIPLALARHRSDLVVEDFGAPFSSVAVPWLTRRPVVGVVQWLFAAEKSRQYHVPFSAVERLGVRSHDRLIAVSGELGQVLARRNPRALVSVVANGLDEVAFEPPPATDRRDFAYLGRLEVAQKGLDLLLDAYARIAGDVEQDLVLGGDGPDRDQLEAMVAERGLTGRVRFAGRIAADARFAWLAAADLVVMPSRYETFGMVAAEAMAMQTPVVAFDIPCLRELVDGGVGVLVPAYDVAAYAEALRSLALDPVRRRSLGQRGPARVTPLRWATMAERQAAIYREALGASDLPSLPPGPPLAPAGSDADGSAPAAPPEPAGPAEPARAAGPPTVVALLRSRFAATPDAVALDDGTTPLTYRQLGEAAMRLSRALVDGGTVPGDPVAVVLPRSSLAIAAMIGIWEAGALYVPIDPSAPSRRIDELAEQAGVRVLVAAEAVGAAYCARLPRIDPVTPTGDAAPAAGPARRLEGDARTGADPDPEAGAYILFTSGSSGRPKAVRVRHRSVAHVLEWVRTTFSPAELALASTSVALTFDPFVIEVLGPLVTGGTVRVVPHALSLADLDVPVTVLVNTPSVVGELYRAGRLPDTLKVVVTGGEALSAQLADDLLHRTSVRRLVHTYGATEATVLSTAHEVTLPVRDPVGVGTALPGVDVALLDAEGRPVETGAVGEIWVAGPQVADGYVGDPDETAARFVRRPLPGGGAASSYRTGDLGRIDDGGQLHFCGRTDAQVKVLGHRIELEEIEAKLARHPAVERAMVRLVGEGPAAHLAAFVVLTPVASSPPVPPPASPADPTSSLSDGALRSWLAERLPEVMVPATYVTLDALPMTEHGKLDRGAGSPPAAGGRAARPDDPSPRPGPGPASPERVTGRVIELARQVLGLEGPVVPADDVLDDLGATSLGLFRLLSAMELTFGCRLAIGGVLDDTTVAGLSALATGARPVTAPGRPNGRSGPAVPRGPLFLVHAYLGTSILYRRLGAELASGRPVVSIHVHDLETSGLGRTSVGQMADTATAQIRAVRPQGPYLVGGHSAGGLIAYEVARRLVDQGETVPLVLLIDSPAVRSRIHYLWGELVLNWPDIRRASARQRLAMVRTVISSRLSHHRRAEPTDRVAGTIERFYRANNVAVSRYAPPPYAGDLAVLWTRQGRRMAFGNRALGWRRVAGGQVETVEIPGAHNTMFEPAQAAVVARRLDALIEALGPLKGGEVR
ncbi:MAG TPA: amino acid adenylation domain-containing protein [Acidimicrobiales bacterium]